MFRFGFRSSRPFPYSNEKAYKTSRFPLNYATRTYKNKMNFGYPNKPFNVKKFWVPSKSDELPFSRFQKHSTLESSESDSSLEFAKPHKIRRSFENRIESIGQNIETADVVERKLTEKSMKRKPAPIFESQQNAAVSENKRNGGIPKKTGATKAIDTANQSQRFTTKSSFLKPENQEKQTSLTLKVDQTKREKGGKNFKNLCFLL